VAFFRRRTGGGSNRVKPHDMVDNRYLDEMTKSGFFDKRWGRNDAPPRWRRHDLQRRENEIRPTRGLVLLVHV
jgi:hypothetical protein